MDKHPDLEMMVRYVDGELPPGRQAEVAEHVGRCQDCLLEVRRLQTALEVPRMAAPPGGALGPAHLETLLNDIQAWRARALSPERRDQVNRRIAAILAPYLGPAGTEKVLRPVTENQPDLLAEVEPVLALFLGAAAASKLTERIVDSVLMEAD